VVQKYRLCHIKDGFFTPLLQVRWRCNACPQVCYNGLLSTPVKPRFLDTIFSPSRISIINFLWHIVGDGRSPLQPGTHDGHLHSNLCFLSRTCIQDLLECRAVQGERFDRVSLLSNKSDVDSWDRRLWPAQQHARPVGLAHADKDLGPLPSDHDNWCCRVAEAV
jgi:hypothetical protein